MAAPDLDSMRESALADVAGAESSRALDDVRVAWLGKKGRLTAELKALAVDLAASD